MIILLLTDTDTASSPQLDPKNYESKLEQIKKERGYNYMDVIQISPEKLHNYEEKVGGPKVTSRSFQTGGLVNPPHYAWKLILL